MAKVAVIGGGVVGLACAYYLRKQNMDVVVVDKDKMGEACSKVNMGWICPTLTSPVPAPGLIGDSMKWMMSRKSPLYIKPSAMPTLSPWLLQFTQHCNERSYQKGMLALREFNRTVLSLFDEIEQDGVQFEMHRKGILHVFMEEEQIGQKLSGYESIESYGLPKPEVLTSQQALMREPHLSRKIAGALYYPRDRSVRPESLTQALGNWLAENHAELKPHTEVTKIIREGDCIVGLQCGSERIEADLYLFTTGAWTGQLTRQLDYSLPLTAGKGYSITYQAPNLSFQQPLYFGADGALTPFEGAVRIGGTMELSGVNTDLDMRRVKNIRASIMKYLAKEIEGESEKILVGMRPMTPDGLPVLGLIPNLKNAYVAAGHAMEGISLSLSTGKIMSDLMTGRQPSIDLTPFAPDRFSWVS